MTALVIGAGGLLGQAVGREGDRRREDWIRAVVPWQQPTAALAALEVSVDRMLSDPRPWRIVWCAGAGVTATEPDVLAEEVALFRSFLELVAARVDRGSRPGVLFVSSSAGGLYAGASGAPFGEDSEPRPISPYGHAKLASEDLARQFGQETGCAVVVGRFANIYGPGQDLSKPQGLISQLCRAQLTGTPLPIYVGMDTMREYLFVDDAAAMTWACLALAEQAERAMDGPGATHVKILGAGQPTTVAAILGELRRLTRRRPPVVLGRSPYERFQAPDLRFRSRRWPEVDALRRTTLSGGIGATLLEVGRLLRAGKQLSDH